MDARDSDQMKDLSDININNNINISNNSMDSASSYFHKDSSMVFAVYCVIAAMGILLNTSVIGVISTCKRLRNVPNAYILNLALTDLLFSCGMPFIVYSTTSPRWDLGPVMCKIANGLDATNQFIGVFILVLMSIDRYLAIVHCMKSVNFKMRKMKGCLLIVAGTWLFCGLITLPAWVYADVEVKRDKKLCHLVMSEYGRTVWALFSVLVGYLLPLLTVAICYGLIFYDLRKTAQNAAVGNVDKTTTKLVKIVLIIILGFIICWTPFYFAIFFMEDININRLWKQRIFELSIGAIYIHPCVNPIIFMASSDTFQKQILHILRWRRSAEQGADFQLTTNIALTCTETFSSEKKTSFANKRAMNQDQAEC